MNTSGALGYTPVVTSPELSAPPASEGPIERVVSEVEMYFHNHHYSLLDMAHRILMSTGHGHSVENVIAAAEKLAKHLEEQVEAAVKKL